MQAFKQTIQGSANPVLATLSLAMHPRVGEHSMLRYLGQDAMGIIGKYVVDNTRCDEAVKVADMFVAVILCKNLLEDRSLIGRAFRGKFSMEFMRWIIDNCTSDSTQDMTDREVRAYFRELRCSNQVGQAYACDCCKCAGDDSWFPSDVWADCSVRAGLNLPNFERVLEYFENLPEREEAFVSLWLETMSGVEVSYEALSFSSIHDYDDVQYEETWENITLDNDAKWEKAFHECLLKKGAFGHIPFSDEDEGVDDREDLGETNDEHYWAGGEW
jgi:hypothetical protein